MTYVLAHNIVSPLGTTTADNLQAVLEGRTAVAQHSDPRGLLQPFAAAFFAGRQNFEQLICSSAEQALASTDIDRSRTVLIVSTTKGEIGTPISLSAEHIAQRLGIESTPITVCNACISGLTATLLGKRLLEAGAYDYAIVCGADVQSEFIVSGFQSLKALSATPCRPFDMERTGLNLGEAAATLVLSRTKPSADAWIIACGSSHNDAYHITQPAKRGDGLLACLNDVMRDESADDLALVSAHGTGTLFNDQMEAVAIARAGLKGVTVNALKGYYGHTLGAAGLLETILTMAALDRRTTIGTRGFQELGVSENIHVQAEHATTNKTTFLKTISGFGGCNAALLVAKASEGDRGHAFGTEQWHEAHRVRLTSNGFVVDGAEHINASNKQELTELYKSLAVDYPKFYKMDILCRLGYIASMLLLRAEGYNANIDKDRRGVILFNRTSSIVSDKKYQQSIARADDYFPSPSAFVYTLPNIVTGEIAISQGYHGETSFYVLPEHDEDLERSIIGATLAQTTDTSYIMGWIDAADDEHFEVDIRLIQKEDTTPKNK